MTSRSTSPRTAPRPKEAIDLARLAELVDTAAREAAAIPQISLNLPLGLDEAYAVQALALERRYARGERPVGIKMGFTSRAKMAQMGLEELIWGRLTDAMRIDDGGEIRLAGFIHPRVEPEIAVLLGKPLAGPVAPAEAMAAAAGVAPAMEVIDSRYRDFRFSLPDVVADNCSSAGFVLGPWSGPGMDISNLGVLLEFDGRPVQVGSSAAVLGHPARSLAAASRLVGAAGLRLEAGWIVMTGGVTAAEPLRPGLSVQATVERLGRVAFRVRA